MTQDDIRGLPPYGTDSYAALPLAELAAYGLYQLEEMDERLTIENVCVALHRLFPGKFAMVGYAEIPDGMRVNRTLLQMRPKYRNFATGSPRQGFSLTPLGRRVAGQVGERLAKAGSRAEGHATAAKEGTEPSRRTFTDESVVAGVRNSELYRMFAQGAMGDARGVHFLGMLDAFSHTPKPELKRRFREIVVAATSVADADLLTFLDECSSRFGTLLREH